MKCPVCNNNLTWIETDNRQEWSEDKYHCLLCDNYFLWRQDFKIQSSTINKEGWSFTQRQFNQMKQEWNEKQKKALPLSATKIEEKLEEDEKKEELRNQNIIVYQRLMYHFGNPNGSFNVPPDLPFMKEFLNEINKLCDMVGKLQ